MENNKKSYYKWELLILLFVAFFFHQADRAIFGVVMQNIQTELHLSDSQIGLTASILFFMTALMVPLAGYVGDRYSRKWIITFSIIFWSIATMLTGLSTGILGIILFRSIATAGSESFYGPAYPPLIAAYHKETRSLALSIHQSALYIGLMFSGFIAGWIAQNYGWRSAFYLFGGIGFFVGILFIFRLKDPPAENVDATQKNQEQALKLKESYSAGQALKTLLRIPSVPLLTLGFVAIVFVNNAYLTWAPRLLENNFELDTIKAGGYSMFYHHFGALLFIIISGFVSDLMARKYPSFRVHLQWIAMLVGAPLILFIGNSNHLTMILITMFLFGAMRGLYEANTHAAIFEVVPARFRSSLVALMIMVAFFIGSISPYMMGKLQDVYGPTKGMSIGFTIFALVWVLGALSVSISAFFTFKKDRQKLLEQENN